MRKPLLAFSMVLAAASLAGAQDPQREPLGSSVGRPVYRDEMREGESAKEGVARLIVAPAVAAYRKQHAGEVTPTPAEIDAFIAHAASRLEAERTTERDAHFRKMAADFEAKSADPRLNDEQRRAFREMADRYRDGPPPPSREIAATLLANWKFQRHLYERFGGGRVLFQQFGLEAFDAHRRFLESLESAGQFAIADPATRAEFYAYWTTQDHGRFLSEKPARIDQLLNPDWLRAAATRPAG